MKKILFSILMLICICSSSNIAAQDNQSDPRNQTVMTLSGNLWKWMADKNTDKLENLFHDNAMFVHMGGTWDKKQEVGIIGGGMIHYKHADIKDSSVRFADNTAVVLTDMNLLAVVGGNEVTNHFMVTEVYVQINNEWKLISLSFTKLNR